MTVNINGDTGVSAIQAGTIQVTDIPDNTITASKLHTQVQGALGTRNLIINGNMNIAQRATSVTGVTSSGYKTCDRWNFAYSNSGTWTHTQDTNVPTGQGFSKSYKLSCTTANASLSTTENLIIRQRFEGQMLQHLKKGTSSAEKLTLSFWVKSNKTGTYIAELYDRDNTRQLSKSYTIDSADTWEKKTITYDGDTTGAFDNNNALSLDIQFWLVAGPDWTSGTLDTTWGNHSASNRVAGQVNLADSTSNYINITGVQLEVGDTATPFEHRPYDMELARCQRYFTKSYEGAISAANAAADGGYESLVLVSDGVGMLTTYFPVVMRTTPDIVIRNTSDGATGQITGVNSVDYAGSVKRGNNQNVTIGPTSSGDRTRVLGFHYEADAEL